MKVYFAGELFSLKHLAGNALLANGIHHMSNGKYLCTLPQALEQRGTTPKHIRDQDIDALINSDLGLFSFDGTEVDSGTVVEFMIAKFLDIPSVIIRTDFRAGGDSKMDPWNLMMSFYPRTEVIVIDSIQEYQQALALILKEYDGSNPQNVAEASVKSMEIVSNTLAENVKQAFDRLLETESIMPKKLKKDLYRWIITSTGMESVKNFSPVFISKPKGALLG